MKGDFVKNYQFVAVYPANLTEDKQKKNLKELTNFVESAGSSISFTDWGEKTLAYEIDGNQTARFWLGDMKVGEEKPMLWNELRTFLDRNKLLIRYLILNN